MDWNAIGTQVILGILGIILTALGTIVTALINKYVKDGNAKKIMESLAEHVGACVREVYQVYVQELKDKGIFDKDAQAKALSMCLEKIKETLPKNIKEWLEENFKDGFDQLLKVLIESELVKFKTSK